MEGDRVKLISKNNAESTAKVYVMVNIKDTVSNMNSTTSFIVELESSIK